MLPSVVINIPIEECSSITFFVPISAAFSKGISSSDHGVFTILGISSESNDMEEIFSKLLYEFKISQVNIRFPGWVDGLESSNNLKVELYKYNLFFLYQ